ncbi:MAG: MBL fold metallo-hydrolase [Nitrososphaerota archaeon]|nr:MBL fold metallo-hydrolase [Nitrososphaerota archaeon]MDG6921936.1 MBL fold metallo-hydrolase [Nitrososphaerota archaeon]
MQKLKLDETEIFIFNVGDLYYALTRINSVPESEWRPAHSHIYENKLPYPMLCFLIRSNGESVLIDAGDYSLMAPIGSEFRPDSYKPPPTIVEQLSEISVRPNDVKSMVITHAHWDHYAAVTSRMHDGSYAPTFSNARHFLGKHDWESAKVQKALDDPNSNDSRTLGVLRRSGLLELVQEKRNLSPRIQIIPCPGESPGHQIVRVQYGEGNTIYFTGDLFHHPVEVEKITWMSKWDDPEVIIKSRKEMIDIALKEDALLQGGHMPLGKLMRTDGGARFVETKP